MAHPGHHPGTAHQGWCCHLTPIIPSAVLPQATASFSYTEPPVPLHAGVHPAVTRVPSKPGPLWWQCCWRKAPPPAGHQVTMVTEEAAPARMQGCVHPCVRAGLRASVSLTLLG